MKYLILVIFTLSISPIFSQCDWNNDGQLDIVDIVLAVDCILNDCLEEDIYGCTDSEALNYNPAATIDDGSCEYAVGDCVDFDGNIYETITIGDQIWMEENLKVIHFNNGDEIPTGFTNLEWTSLSTGAYVVYDDDPNNAVIYGNLYNWYAVDDYREICPEYYHVPTDEEWIDLEIYLGMSLEVANTTGYRGSNEGGMLKEGGTLNWWAEVCGNPVCPNGINGCNCSGFTARPGGNRRFDNGVFHVEGNAAWFWTADEYGSSAWIRRLDYGISSIYRYMDGKQGGSSIRCVQD